MKYVEGCRTAAAWPGTCRSVTRPSRSALLQPVPPSTLRPVVLLLAHTVGLFLRNNICHFNASETRPTKKKTWLNLKESFLPFSVFRLTDWEGLNWKWKNIDTHKATLSTTVRVQLNTPPDHIFIVAVIWYQSSCSFTVFVMFFQEIYVVENAFSQLSFVEIFHTVFLLVTLSAVLCYIYLFCFGF